MNNIVKKVLMILLVFMMVLTVACGAAETGNEQAVTPAKETSELNSDIQQMPAEKSEPASETEPVEKNGDIVILYTSDVHCGIDQGFGYAGLQQVKEYLIEAGNDVILVDDGDSIQGEPIGTMTNGEAIIPLMNRMGYDVVTIGNHEFDYGMEQFLALVQKADFPYVCCNFTYKGELVFDPYVTLERSGKKIAFVGICTPETLTESTPRYFKDDSGEFVYGFCEGNDGLTLYEAVQSAVDAARGEGADYVIAVAHLGNAAESAPYTYADVITHTSGIDVFFDGHSHDTDQVIVKNKDGKDVPRGGVGTKLSCVGWCRISADGTVSTGLYTWNNTVAAPELLGIENDMSRAVEDAQNVLNEKLNEVIATAAVELTINDPVETDSNGKPIRMVRRAETNLGDFCADAFRIQSGADIAMIGGGGIRVSLAAGDITMRNILSVFPFGNSMCVLEVTGRQILDALEWSVNAVPGEFGGFQHVSGLSFEIHSYIASPCLTDADGMFAGVKGERRVKNVFVNGEPLDPEKTYTLGGINYWLLEKGNGFSMFADAPILQNCVKLDNQVLIDYIRESLGGVIGEEYVDPYGQGRIVIIEEKP